MNYTVICNAIDIIIERFGDYKCYTLQAGDSYDILTTYEKEYRDVQFVRYDPEKRQIVVFEPKQERFIKIDINSIYTVNVVEEEWG